MSNELQPPRNRWFRRWLIRLAALFIFILLLVAFAPWLIARSPLCSWVVAQAIGPIDGSVHVGSATLGWLSGPELRDVELRDRAGQRLLFTPKIRLAKSLAAILRNQSNIGQIDIDSPEFIVAVDGDSTNWEKALAPQFTSSGGASPALAVNFNQAKITLRDGVIDWTAQAVTARIAQTSDPNGPITFQVAADIAGDAPGKIELDGDVTLAAATQAHARLKVEQFPLAMLAAVVKRFDPSAKIEGRLSGQVSVAYADGEQSNAAIDGEISLRDFACSQSALGPDRVRLAKLDLPCRLSKAGSRWNIEKLKVSCDLGQASVAGQFELGSDPAVFLQQPGIELTADVDLAGLCAQLPHTLSLQAGTRISTGRLTADVHSAATSNGVAWSGHIATQNLRGERDGQPLALDTPVSVEFAIRHSPGALPLIDKLKCQSDFLNIEGAGSADQATVRAIVDLGLLEKRLGQFVDFGGIHPAGRGDVTLTVQRDSAGHVQLAGSGKLADLAIALPGSPAIQEKEIALRLDAAGVVQNNSFAIASAGLRVNSGSEEIGVELASPHSLRQLKELNARLTMRGALSRWRTRLTPFVELPAGWQMDGAADASARLHLSSQAIELVEAQGTVRDFRFIAAGARIQEPVVALKPTTLRWDRAKSRLELAQAALTCPTVTAEMSQLALESGPAGTNIALKAALRGDLARLAHWFPGMAPESLNGTLAGPLDLQLQSGAVSGGVDLSLSNVTIGNPASPSWSEPAIRLAARGQYDSAHDNVQIERLEFATSEMSASAEGRATRLSADCLLSVSGQLDYDLEKLQPRLRRYLGPEARVSGRGRRPFRVEGPLSSAGPAPSAASPFARLKVEAGFGWQDIEAFGFRVGPAELQLRMLGDGWARIHPVTASLNQGKLKLEPYVKLEPAPIELVLGKSTAIERAKITEVACAKSLGYAAPVFAGVHDAEGEFSLSIDGGRVPLADPLQADIWGKITIHSARATPGPLVQELNQLLHKPSDLKLPHELSAPVRLYQGRMYHSNLEIPLSEFTVKTSGSVGLDGTLALVAEMPVPPKWIANNALAPTLAKQTIKLPIAGTLAKPHIDDKALRQEMARFMQHAAENAVKSELEKGLQKLLQPPKK